IEIKFRDDDFPCVESARFDLEKGLVERGPLGAVLRATFENGAARDDWERATVAGVVILGRRRDRAAGLARIGAIHGEINRAAGRAGKSHDEAVGHSPALLVEN